MKTLPRKKLLLSRADNSAHVLRGLISYHKRMTSGNCPERDSHLDALRYALALVEKKRRRYEKSINLWYNKLTYDERKELLAMWKGRDTNDL